MRTETVRVQSLFYEEFNECIQGLIIDSTQDSLGTRFRVGLSVGLLIGAKVRTWITPDDFSLPQIHTHWVSVRRLIQATVTQCPSSILLQIDS